METARHGGSDAAEEQSYTTAFLVDRSPEEVYRAINDVRSWWSGRIDGDTDRLGGEFRYRYRDLHDTRQRVTELVPGKRIVWRVVDALLTFVERKEEWKGTEVVFDIARKGGKTEVRFRHLGLTRACECYGACSSGWDAFVNGNLRSWIATGEVQPSPFEG
ncbi:MAG: SRPBCC domain-containing protein [Deltaproteobacteria bacterium]|nr:SRPBCC domain-containing protein [Deltaproteobacteria bacterium]